MDLLLDNIIYSLQHGGGASVVWTEHISRLLEDNRFATRFIEFEGCSNNVFRRNLDIPCESIDLMSKSFLCIKRYLDIKSRLSDPYIFHSSHYRVDNCPYAMNVTTVHDFVYEYYVRGLRKTIHSHQKWNAIRKADKVICISESTKNDLLRFLPDVKEEKTIVIYNGVDEKYRPIIESDYQLNLPFFTNEYIVYVGNRYTPYKNFNLAVEVCREIKKPLILIGGEMLSKKEEIWLNDILGKDYYMSMRGISNEVLNEVYNRAFAVLYPSQYEGFGIPVIEAQKAGVPVVCFKNSSIQEVAGDTELCVPEMTVSAVVERMRYLELNDYRNNEIKKGLINAQRFSWDKTYQQTTDLYLSLVKEH